VIDIEDHHVKTPLELLASSAFNTPIPIAAFGCCRALWRMGRCWRGWRDEICSWKSVRKKAFVVATSGAEFLNLADAWNGATFYA